MTTILNFKDIVDLPKWRIIAPVPQGGGVNGYQGWIYDMRNNEDRHPFLYWVRGDRQLQAYNVKGDNWIDLGIQLIATTQSFSGGAFMSAQGPRGTIAAGATTTSFTLTTALPAAVGVNQLANRGDGRGYKVRIIGNSAGGSGKTEERYVVANTSGTTPLINVDTPFSFTPANGDAYEFLSGRVYGIGGTNAAGNWKFYDVLTNSLSANLSTAGLPASWADGQVIGMDELSVPYDKNPGEGFKGLLTATASGAASLTGQAAGGDATVLANEHRNFQIRIVQDTAIPTAVGQRRNITSHTAGPSPVYTVPAWAVTPSATAQYVIENNGDRIIAFLIISTNTFTYHINGTDGTGAAANTWDTTTFAAQPAVRNVGCSQQSFGIEPDIATNARHSFIFSFRTPSIANTLDLFDIAGAATGTWTSDIAYGNKGIQLTFALGSSYNSATMQGRYMYIGGGTQQFYRFDMQNRILEPYSYLRATLPSGTGGTKSLANTVFVDGNTKLSFLIFSTNVAAVTGSVYSAALPITR